MEEARPPVEECSELAAESPLPGEPLPAPDQEELTAAREEAEMWRDRALRLEAEIDNFRKRQRRLAEERVTADRERLLRAVLSVADDLSRALAADGADAEGLREGVMMTYQSLERLLDQEGVTPLQAEGEPFDPAYHEAVSTVPHQEAGVEPNHIVKVLQPGYQMGERLLRPARVVVAV